MSGRLRTYPAVRCFSRGKWANLTHEPLRPEPRCHVTTERLEQLFGPSRQRLVSCPLYISLDKDVMVQADAFVNWDSGHLHLAEVQTILQWFISASNGNLAGMDIVGDWSPVQVSGLPRRVLGWIEHPRLAVDPVATDRRNERTNLALLELVSRLGATGAMLSRPLHVLATE